MSRVHRCKGGQSKHPRKSLMTRAAKSEVGGHKVTEPLNSSKLIQVGVKGVMLYYSCIQDIDHLYCRQLPGSKQQSCLLRLMTHYFSHCKQTTPWFQRNTAYCSDDVKMWTAWWRGLSKCKLSVGPNVWWTTCGSDTCVYDFFGRCFLVGGRGEITLLVTEEALGH